MRYLVDMTNPTNPTNPALILNDKHSGGRMFLNVRDGVVVGAMGSDPKRYIGLTVDRAKHIARYGGR